VEMVLMVLVEQVLEVIVLHFQVEQKLQYFLV
jgi:hypothetical protein